MTTQPKTASGKRKRAPTNPLELACRKTDEQFVTDYLAKDPSTPWTTLFTHPTTHSTYTLRLVGAQRLPESLLQACFSLVSHTSRSDYERSSKGWRPAAKLEEMRSKDLRYILVELSPTTEVEETKLCGFTSLMPTYEEGTPVLYCYEIHLAEELRGSGIGRLLMRCLDEIAGNLGGAEKVMLTCFVANERAMRFYGKVGYVVDGISPRPRRLRGGKVKECDYVILSKMVRRRKRDEKEGKETQEEEWEDV